MRYEQAAIEPPARPTTKSPQSPVRQNRTGQRREVSRRSIGLRPRPDEGKASITHDRVTQIGAPRVPLCPNKGRGIRFGLCPVCPLGSVHRHPMRRCVFLFRQHRQGMSIPVQQARRAISTGVFAPDIERRPDLRQISSGLLANRTHPRPRQWLWLAGDGCASYPLAATVQPKVSSLGLRPFLARQETPVCTVLHSVSALRVQREQAPA